MIAVALALAAAVYFLHPYAVVAYLARSIAAATTASGETEALCRADRWVRPGRAPTYPVGTRDRAALRPWQDGSYERVAAVTLTWTTGQSVTRELPTRDGLSCVRRSAAGE
ncbi:hypothetical protein SAMN02745121_09036 [Nannocystis exedens]|uniref:Uncharacterized protein n=1 Tax=Nannocystis exedens TaxID=54 RepID=A0A1I2IWH0_9BACT|nr:hypothetical protein [Nannocystis exedens]PCC67176.1 hypothetical protein NAEX_00179 [Nannocystis exedens]SFF46539.1 hypothetical protein SAMN02745121_09036 [Nannocystis exedens]